MEQINNAETKFILYSLKVCLFMMASRRISFSFQLLENTEQKPDIAVFSRKLYGMYGPIRQKVENNLGFKMEKLIARFKMETYLNPNGHS